MKLWWKRISEHETHTCHSEQRPGNDWYELEREVAEDQTVRVDGDMAVIERLPADERKLDPNSMLAAALPDILLAVADGADLRDELKKVLSKVEAPSGER